MAVTNSLFMLACPPLFHCELPRRLAPTTKEVGATHFVSVASDDGSSWPCRTSVYHSVYGFLPEFTRRRRVARPTCRGAESGRLTARRHWLRALLFRRRLCRRTG